MRTMTTPTVPATLPVARHPNPAIGGTLRSQRECDSCRRVSTVHSVTFADGLGLLICAGCLPGASTLRRSHLSRWGDLHR